MAETTRLNDIIGAAIEAPAQRTAFTILTDTSSFVVDEEDVRRIKLASRMKESSVRVSVLDIDLKPYRDIVVETDVIRATVRHNTHPIAAKSVEE